MAFDIVAEHGLSIKSTQVVPMGQTYACVVFLEDGPSLVGIAGRGELVALELSVCIDGMVNAMKESAFLGVGT